MSLRSSWPASATTSTVLWIQTLYLCMLCSPSGTKLLRVKETNPECLHRHQSFLFHVRSETSGKLHSRRFMPNLHLIKFLHPQIVPLWIAPNVLTFSGFVMILVNYFLISFYDWDYTASGTSPGLVPTWVWLFSAFTTFCAYTLDSIDGKHARRTQSSSPLGELFDHGLDSWATSIFVLSFFSVCSRDNGKTGVSVYTMYIYLSIVLFNFMCSHWEKYNTGVLFLPWGYDLSQVASVYFFHFHKHYTTFAVQSDNLPDEQHQTRTFPLVPVSAGSCGLRSNRRAPGLDRRNGACHLHCISHGRACALWHLRGEAAEQTLQHLHLFFEETCRRMNTCTVIRL
ncbi:cholinephosphotransferase 1-like isoform X4 [Apteryx mantelli]|uniref:Cholinephosphotransferase 1-like isoform X4 n=1 Tax=Apteryx mantelli TaxID=2696672 RepID=A0ABM4E1Q4_9AVES